VAIAGVVLAAGIVIELHVKHDSGHSERTNVTSVTSVTTGLKPPGASGSACGDLPSTQVLGAIGAGAGKNPVMHSIVAVEPGWLRSPSDSECIWTVFNAKMDVVSALDLFVAQFPTTAGAAGFYQQEVASGKSGGPAWQAVAGVGTAALFLPQSNDYAGGDIEVLKGKTAVRMQSFVHATKTSSAKQSLQTLETLTAAVLTTVGG
jgi:hypothetical protein